MELDPKKFQVDESRSNPMVVAQQYPGCPINEICFFLVVGFGSVLKQCEHLEVDSDKAECLYDVSKKLGGE